MVGGNGGGSVLVEWWFIMLLPSTLVVVDVEGWEDSDSWGCVAASGHCMSV